MITEPEKDMRANLFDLTEDRTDMKKTTGTDETEKLVIVKRMSTAELNAVRTLQVPQKPDARKRRRSIPKQDASNVHVLTEQCRQICLSAFFNEHAPVRSLGFTSSLGGEGKSFLSIITAQALADDSNSPVILVECNWDHPSLHKYFGIASSFGLAEWLRGECSEEIIRYEIGHNLTVIPAGRGKQDAVKLLHQIQQKGLLDLLAHSNDLLILDLPAVVTTAYGTLAARLVESLVIVACAGETHEALLAETLTRLEGLPVQGVVLNQIETRIPHWIQQIL
jgi:Mrp family chromosome partitioning ATPase